MKSLFLLLTSLVMLVQTVPVNSTSIKEETIIASHCNGGPVKANGNCCKLDVGGHYNC